MKAFVLQNGFGLENLALIDRPEPIPGPGQVAVRIRAASLNYRDLLVATGKYSTKLQLPRVIGSDGAGEVVAVGEGVTDWKTGDRVIGTFFQNWEDGSISEEKTRGALGADRDGVLTEIALLEAHGLVRVPANLSFEQAATLPCAALTAWNALSGAECGPGKTVLLQGTGGVSIFALQFAVALGARVLITSGNDDKLARALQLGAESGVNYKKNPDWDKWARQQTGGVGVDIVVEVGGAGTLERSSRSVRYGGHIALIGVLAGAVSFNPIYILMRAITLQGLFVGPRSQFETMNECIADKRIEPVIDRIVPFDGVSGAIQQFESSSHFGKVVIRVG